MDGPDRPAVAAALAEAVAAPTVQVRCTLRAMGQPQRFIRAELNLRLCERGIVVFARSEG